MLDIVLYQPEIPPNTGNVIRLCANVGARLHLIEPLGFDLTEKSLQRAGMDYAELTIVSQHRGWKECAVMLAGRPFYFLSTRGTRRLDEVRFERDAVLVFGPESRGLPAELLASADPNAKIRLPMMPGCRSLNLSNTVAVVAYEAWRQNGFLGGL
ncbi:MAG: tRNA (cytidine(34)-2'-O)-methyltransferase [Uliginosibacterium sp.]|nr:tRNA (cytidine(34)-2'-O)-methyltransferase [Uliginosibacterium sp.]